MHLAPWFLIAVPLLPHLTHLTMVGPASSQDSNKHVIARFELLGEPASVSRDDLALELAGRFQRTEKGRAALQHLVDMELVRIEARAHDLMPTADEARARLQEIERQLAAQKIALPVFLRQRGMSREEFAEYTTLSLAHERLVLRAIGQTAVGHHAGQKAMSQKERAQATPELLQLWLKEARERHAVSEDQDQLPAGIVARIGRGPTTRDLVALELGRVIHRTTSQEERERYLKQIIVCRVLEARAAQGSVSVAPEELMAEVAARRREVEASAARGAPSFDQILASQGTSAELLARSAVLRAQVLLRKLVSKAYPDSELDRMLAEQRPVLQKKHGARRKLAIILLRATERPNALIPRDLAGARKLAETLRETIDMPKPFEVVAATQSDDPETKARGGDLGWRHQVDPAVPAEVLAEAFALRQGEISAPIQTKDGIVLVKVMAVEPEPSDAQYRSRMLLELEDRYREQLLRDAKIEIVSS